MISLSPGCRHLSLKLSHHSIKIKAVNCHYIKHFIFSISDEISLSPGCRHLSLKLSHHSFNRKAVNGHYINLLFLVYLISLLAQDAVKLSHHSGCKWSQY